MDFGKKQFFKTKSDLLKIEGYKLEKILTEKNFTKISQTLENKKHSKHLDLIFK